MKLKKLALVLAIAFGFSLLVITTPVVVTNANVTTRSVEARVVENYILESAHPYSNNFDYTWKITKPGATQIRVHFVKIDTEYRYDYVYVYDYAQVRLHSLTGLYSYGGWTAWSYGDSIYVRLDTDYSITDWGFAIDQIEYEGGTPDTTAPTVSITSPTDGSTVSGTVTVEASASDDVGVDRVEFFIDGTYKATDTSAPYTYSWDTTAETDGAHTVKAVAYDAAGNNDYDQISVTVDNSGGGTGNVLTSGETVYSSLSTVGETEMWTIEVGPNCLSMHSVLNCGTADFDLYGRLGAEPTTTVYDWRGYTYGGEDVTYANPGEGTWYIMVRDYSGSGPYDLTVTLTYDTGGGDTWGTGGKYAIVVGISDYLYISDLSYCDEDATDWYYQLNGMGYEVHVYGDTHTTNYPVYTGDAYESTVRTAIQDLATHAQPGDTVCFVTSGHGSGDGAGSSYLCMLDCSGSAGCYYDTEIAADIGLFASGVNIFIFIDHCYSGGIGPELMALSTSSYIYCTTTCTENGYGYDDSTHQNGAWTYYFLDYSWQTYYGNNPSQSMESIFSYALANYPYSGGDTPQEFDGNTGSYFYLG
ncbi:MAG: Ig-like domain-containing protein [Candidatus Hodarchaeales archaeon]